MRSLKIKEKCKGSARINSLTEEFVRLHHINHGLNSYKTELYSLKYKCKDESRISRESLSIVFRDAKGNQAISTEFSYKYLERTAYRGRLNIRSCQCIGFNRNCSFHPV